MAKVRPNRALEIVASGFSNSSGLVKGNIVNLAEVTASVRRAAEEVELKSGNSVNRVIAGISGSHIKSHNSHGAVEVKGKHGEVTAKDMENVIRAASIPFSPEFEIIHEIPQEFMVNNQSGVVNPVGMAGSQLEINLHIVSCDSALCQSLINSANKAQIEVKRVILQSIASGAAVLTPSEKELGTVVMDIGGGTTDIAVYLNNSVCFTSVIPVGGEHFTRDLVAGLRASREEAERIKVELGHVQPGEIESDEMLTIQRLGMRGPCEFPRNKMCEILHDRCAELLELVRDDILHSGVQDRLIGGAILTGGGSMLGGILDLAESILQMPVRQGLPLGFEGLTKELTHPSYACAIGLTLLEAQRLAQLDSQKSSFTPPQLIDRIIGLFES
jgi:cell division protein FtsA